MATVSGSTARMPMAKAGASMSNVKRHAVVFVVIIKTNKRMPDNVYQFCGNCYWYDVDDDHRASAWCMKRKCKTSCFDVCKDHKF